MEHLTPAERMYKRHLTNVKNYQKRNPEKMALKYKKRIEKLKLDPEAFKLFRQKQNESNKRCQLRKKEALEIQKLQKTQQLEFDILASVFT
jgi:hypothetical protein